MSIKITHLLSLISLNAAYEGAWIICLNVLPVTVTFILLSSIGMVVFAGK